MHSFGSIREAILPEIRNKRNSAQTDFLPKLPTQRLLDRFTGSVILSGDVQSVETALLAVTDTLQRLLNFDTVAVTKT